MEDYKVFITRHPQDYEGGVIPISEITGLKWEDQSGGVGKRHGGYCLYGYIDYNLAAKTVRCSGEHEGYHKQAKIFIPKSSNAEGDYEKGYKELLKIAPEKPESKISLQRPKGAPPCTKRILQVIGENPSITRGEIKSSLCNEGYPNTTVCNSLKTLIRNQKITTEGSSYSPYQKFKIAD